MFPCRYILLNCSLSDLYVIAKGTYTYLISLGYTGLSLMEVRNWRNIPRKNVLENSKQ